jgi:hypothetical protein
VFLLTKRLGMSKEKVCEPFEIGLIVKRALQSLLQISVCWPCASSSAANYSLIFAMHLRVETTFVKDFDSYVDEETVLSVIAVIQLLVGVDYINLSEQISIVLMLPYVPS